MLDHHFSQKTSLSTKENNHEAVVLEEQGVINVREVPDVPAPGLGELKIAPHTVGVCGSDLHYYTHGRVGKYVVEQPMILGHEASGTVVEVGPGVEGFKVGDRVAMEPGIPDMSSRAANWACITSILRCVSLPLRRLMLPVRNGEPSCGVHLQAARQCELR